LIVALIGCGFIGGTVAKFIEEKMGGNLKIAAVYDDVREYAERLSSTLPSGPRVASFPEEMFSDPTVNLVIEAASQVAVKLHVPKALAAGKSVLIMSVGALADDEFFREIESIAHQKQVRIYVPSGAIAGLDWIKAASQVGLDQVIITVRKRPEALEGSPFVVKNKIGLSAIREPTLIFEGPANEASSSFPANVNVAIALSLAGIGATRTRVRVIADPTVTRNVHEILAEGPPGRISIRVENEPSPANPRTSWVAALSANEKLKQMTSSISIG
jgi:aspartate dehydrogenase